MPGTIVGDRNTVLISCRPLILDFAVRKQPEFPPSIDINVAKYRNGQTSCKDLRNDFYRKHICEPF